MNADLAATDGEIVDAVRGGAPDRFAEIVRRYRGPLARLALNRLGQLEWAEDAVQETFWCAFKSLDTYDARYSFRTWLWTILLNQCRRRWRGQRRPTRVLAWTDCAGDLAAAPPDRADNQPSPFDRLLAKEQSEILARLLRRLPEVDADALRLRFYGDLTFPEIAHAMGCSQSAAKLRVRRGLERLSAMLGDAERPPNAAAALGAATRGREAEPPP